MPDFDLDQLAKIIAARASAGGGNSYTRKLLDEGVQKCAKKALVAESADLLYHLLVLLEARGVKLADIYAELERRTAQSGLEEKASRKG
jgi:phosphoribosyl-ATP pyrophosphohydrolase